MKAKIINVEKINNSQVNLTVQIIKNDGTVLTEVTRGFTSLGMIKADVKNEIIENIKRIRDSIVQQNQGVLHNVSTTNLNVELDIA